jgi:uncharacterized RDD family membrane protein YckC
VDPYAAPKVQQELRSTSERDPWGGRGERLAAVILHSLLFLPGYLVIFLPIFLSQTPLEQDVGVSPLLMSLAFAWLAVLVIAQIVFLVKYSASIGKRALGLYIANIQTGQPANWVTTIIVRGFVNGLISSIPCIGPIYSIVDVLFIFGNERRCVHDLLAQTVVLKRT